MYKNNAFARKYIRYSAFSELNITIDLLYLSLSNSDLRVSLVNPLIELLLAPAFAFILGNVVLKIFITKKARLKKVKNPKNTSRFSKSKLSEVVLYKKNSSIPIKINMPFIPFLL